MLQKTEINGIYKTDEGALINKNNDALVAYRKMKEKNRKFSFLEEEIKTLHDEITEMKKYLKGLAVNDNR